MDKYIKPELIKIAKEQDVFEILSKDGIPMFKKGNEIHSVEHDSLVITPNKGFYWFNRGVGSKSPIDYYMQVEGYTFVDACYKVLDVMKYEFPDTGITFEKEKNDKSERKNNNFNVPERAVDDKRAYAYLVKTRHIDPDIVSGLMKKGVIYQCKEHGNVVFLGYDYNGNPASAFKRSTNTNITDSGFLKGEHSGSDKRYRFRIENENSNVVNVFEAEIDLLSYLTMQNEDERNENYISLGGISEKALDEYLLHRKNISEINICTDNDKAGQECFDKIFRKYAYKYKITRELPLNKDFNQDLIEDAEQRKKASKHDFKSDLFY